MIVEKNQITQKKIYIYIRSVLGVFSKSTHPHTHILLSIAYVEKVCKFCTGGEW